MILLPKNTSNFGQILESIKKKMINLPGYTELTKINEGQKTIIYRGQKIANQQSVIIKVLKADFPRPIDIANLKHQYEITKDLNFPGIVKCMGLERYNHSFALIMEDSGGQSLDHFIPSLKNDIDSFLKIAIELVTTLGEIHQIPIIHKDIKPRNIIINQATGQIKITDFSISSRLSKEFQRVSDPHCLEGTLPYISPEQTGRMNRSIDYRSDFYSLGVTFYEMLTGVLPFSTSDAMELVYCHIAKYPLAPVVLNPDIPKVISEITMKLLAKTAEQRYQSAIGIKADLETCLTQLETTGTILPFSLGTKDICPQLIIPQKLYGREEEVASLMSAFERIATFESESPEIGRAEMVLVSGYSGIGKTAIVNEVHKPIVAARGYFIAGKFDQFKRNIPYASLIQAIQLLIQQILTESAAQIEIWKENLLKALDENGAVITNVIPEVELIIGTQLPVAELGPTESLNRFNRVFQQFFRVFCQPQHPLVLFLDDLQWADSASLKLIQILMSESDHKYFLMIGAYRDNEVDHTHPLIQTLEKIQTTGTPVNYITIKPLQLTHVTTLIAETLTASLPTKNLQSLGELLFNKTQGNPFFLTQLLRTLYTENLLSYDLNDYTWKWDIKEIQTVGITDYSVVELLARNIQKLAIATQKVLQLAACIGNTFNLDILAIVNQESNLITSEHLWSALQLGLILPLNENYKIPLTLGGEELEEVSLKDTKVDYKFLHDRVQQAAYSLIPESEKKSTHFQIGKLLLKKINPSSQKDNIFALVNQLNFGKDLIREQSEKNELANLNLIAGQKAKTATAYDAAVKYFQVGLELLPDQSWEIDYNMTLQLHTEAAEAEFLNTNFDRSEQLAIAVLQRAITLIDQVKIYEIKIQSYIAQNQLTKAIDTGIEVLGMLGIHLEAIATEHPILKLPAFEELENAPEMTDPNQIAALRILINISGPASIAKPEIFLPIILTQIKFCLEHGNCSLAAYAYSIYGLLLCGVLGDLDTGYHAGQLGLKLLEKFHAKELTAKVYTLFNVTVRHWKEDARQTVEALQIGVQSGLETGDVEYAAYCALNYCAHIFLVGEDLENIAYKQTQYLNLLIKIKQGFGTYYIKIWHQLVDNLLLEVTDKFNLNGASFQETEMLPILEKANNQISLFVFYLAKTILCYLFKDFAGAIKNAALADQYKVAAPGHITQVIHNFYYSLALLAEFGQISHLNEQHEYLTRVDAHQKILKTWAESAPNNYQHKYELVSAEILRVKGQNWEAMEYYDRAINGARNNKYLQEEALAYEIAAEFYLASGKSEIGATYLKSAYYSYVRWDAKTKVKDLECRYPQILSNLSSGENLKIEETISRKSSGSISSSSNSSIFDLATIMKASQTLASEIVLTSLLEKLMKIAIEHAGATVGALILVKDHQLMIAALGSVEPEKIIVKENLSSIEEENLPLSLINYVTRTQKDLVLNNASDEDLFRNDHYIINYQPKSVLCIPILNRGSLVALIYLENNLITSAFTIQRQEVLKLITGQAAISLENAFLYKNLSLANHQLEEYNQNLEAKVEERTKEVMEKNILLQESAAQIKEKAAKLELTLKELQQTQTHLIQTEKMTGLGQLVAGIAHEINNPISFIYGNVLHAYEYMEDLIRLVNAYQGAYPDSDDKIPSEIQAIDFSFIKKDFPKLLDSMNIGAKRIRDIVLSLRNFSRHDESDRKRVDIHVGLDSTLLILQHRLSSSNSLEEEHQMTNSLATNKEIKVVKNYGELPLVECYPGQLNQVFMNIIANAIDVLESMNQAQCPEPTIQISTEVNNSKKTVIIQIRDNGSGMSETVRQRVFDPFFTTKPVGGGTGLGLSVAHAIIVQKHSGNITCISAPDQGAEFVIEIPWML